MGTTDLRCPVKYIAPVLSITDGLLRGLRGTFCGEHLTGHLTGAHLTRTAKTSPAKDWLAFGVPNSLLYIDTQFLYLINIICSLSDSSCCKPVQPHLEYAAHPTCQKRPLVINHDHTSHSRSAGPDIWVHSAPYKTKT